MMKDIVKYFQTLVNGKYPEGYEIYNPLIQTGNSNLIDFFLILV